MGAAVVGTDPVGDILSAEQPVRGDDGALAMHPLGFDWVEPGTLDGQSAGQNTHALPLLLDGAVVRPNPGPHPLAHMPGSVVPDQRPHARARVLQPGAAPGQELLGDGAHRAAIDEAQPDALRLPDLAQEHPIAGQGLGAGVSRAWLLPY